MNDILPFPHMPPQLLQKRKELQFRYSQHRPKSSVSRDALSWAAWLAILRCWLAMPKGKSDKQTLAHRILSISHLLQSTLLVMNLFVFRHVRLAAKVIEISSISLRVELWDKWCALSTDRVPIDLGKVLMVVDILDRGKALDFGVDATILGLGRVYNHKIKYLPCDEVPCSIADKVVWILPDRSRQNFSPVLQVLPGLINRSTSEGRETSQSLEMHASQTPIINRELVLISLQNFGGHVIG